MALIPVEERRSALGLAAAALLTCALVAGIHRESPRTAISAHGMLHSAITYQIASAPFELPPENPFFAGEPLRYYWFFHALGAAVGSVTGLDPLRSLELLILFGTAALFAAAGALARSLYGRVLPGLWIALLVLVGAKPFAVFVAGWRYLRTGDSLYERDYLWGLVHPVVRSAWVYDPYSLWGPLLNFFLNITSRPLAVASLLLTIAALHAVLRHGGWARALALSGVTALCASFSMLFGASGAGALAGGVALLALVGRNREPAALGASLSAHAPLAIGSLLFGLLLAAPSFAHMVGGEGGATAMAVVPPGDWPDALRAMAEAACLTLPLGLWAAWTARGQRRDFLCILLLASAAFMVAATVVDLPLGSQNNFFQAALVPIGVVATGALVSDTGALRRWRAAAIAAVFAPTAAIVIAGYTGRPDVPIAFEGAQLVRTPAEAPLARLYEWIRNETDPDAVFVIEPRRPIRAMSGNTAELPALTHRALFTLRNSHYIVSDYPDVERRIAIALQLLDGKALAGRDESYLAALGRPIFLLSDDPLRTPQRLARLAERHGPPLRREGSWRIYRVPTGRPQPDVSAEEPL